MIDVLTSVTGFQLFSITGSAIAILGALICGIAYQGKDGQLYSPLNHFISELGEVGISHLAWVFNLGLMLNGFCLIPASLSLGFLIPGLLAKLGMAAGILSGLGLFFVGVYPMNKMDLHARAALTYFRATLGMVIFFSLAIALGPEAGLVLPRTYALAGVPVILAFAGFLILTWAAARKVENPLLLEERERPNVWALPIMEWLTFLTLVIWVWMISAGMK